MAQPCVRFGGKTFHKRRRQPRLPNPGLAGNEHHLAFTGLGLGPAAKQQFRFFFPANEDSQAGRVQRLETALDRAAPQRHPGLYWLGNALEVPGSKVLKLEQIAEKPSRAVSDDDHIRAGDLLQACREVRCLANNPALLRVPLSDQVPDHNKPGRNADAGLQRGQLEAAHHLDQLEPCPDRPFGIVLVREGIAEVHEHSVAHVFGYKPVEAAHRLGDGFLIGRDDLTQVFRVHPGGERRRPDQIRKHHRNVAALGTLLRLWFSNYGPRR
jgi:hypothetical protein